MFCSTVARWVTSCDVAPPGSMSIAVGSVVDRRVVCLVSVGDGGADGPLSISRSLSEELLGDSPPTMLNLPPLCVRTRLT